MTTDVSAPSAQTKSRRTAKALPAPEGMRVADLDVSVNDLAGFAGSDADPRVLLNDTLAAAPDAEEITPSANVATLAPTKAPHHPRPGFAPRPGVRSTVREVHIDTPFSSTPRKLEANLRHLPHVLAVDTLHHEPHLKHTSRSRR
jgi:hypothetical protein